MPHESSQPPPISNGAPPSADDHDESLVRWFLSLTPAQRLDVLNANTNAILCARAAQFPTCEDFDTRSMRLDEIIAAKELLGVDQDRGELPIVQSR